MLMHGKTNEGRAAINQMLNTIRSLAEANNDENLMYDDNPEIITGNKLDKKEDYNFDTVCTFLCEKMPYINAAYLSARPELQHDHESDDNSSLKARSNGVRMAKSQNTGVGGGGSINTQNHNGRRVVAALTMGIGSGHGKRVNFRS